MSADNWAVCPRCLLRARKERERKMEAAAAAAAAYGKVDRAAWLEMQSDAGGPVESDEFTTFREDYRLGIDDGGKFKVEYSGFCGACGLRFGFRHEARVEDLDAPRPDSKRSQPGV
jgi:hypothetical protein